MCVCVHENVFLHFFLFFRTSLHFSLGGPAQQRIKTGKPRTPRDGGYVVFHFFCLSFLQHIRTHTHTHVVSSSSRSIPRTHLQTHTAPRWSPHSTTEETFLFLPRRRCTMQRFSFCLEKQCVPRRIFTRLITTAYFGVWNLFASAMTRGQRNVHIRVVLGRGALSIALHTYGLNIRV